MDLHAYLTKHDGKPRTDGAECIRLAKAVGRSSYFLYLAALGHKQFGPDTALRLHEESVGRRIDPAAVNDKVQWVRAGKRVIGYRKDAA